MFKEMQSTYMGAVKLIKGVQGGMGDFLRLPYTISSVSRLSNDFEITWIVEFFMTSKCERPNFSFR